MTDESFSIHQAAAEGFQKAPEVYESGRPDFPPEAIRYLAKHLSIDSASHVLELGAGTGKLTRLLVPLGCHITAVEPVEGMRRKFASLLPEVFLMAGTAESLPLEAETVDVVLVATAFHWFDYAKALVEIHRVLKPGGWLGLLWNVRDESAPWVAQLAKIIEPYEGDTPRYKTFQWKKVFDETVLFTPLQKTEFPFIQMGNIQTVLDRTRSVSFVAALKPIEQEKVLDAVRQMLEIDYGVKPQAVLDIPYRTDLFWCVKR
jgi:SAM-dependent methyltransferase